MTQQQIKLLTEICLKAGTDPDFYRVVYGLLPNYETLRNYLILGFLNSKSVLKAWFGEELICKFYKGIAEECEGEDECGHLEMWQYHGQQMIGFSVDQMLEYFDQNRRGK